jgi:hypothetical protein
LLQSGISSTFVPDVTQKTFLDGDSRYQKPTADQPGITAL